MGAGQSTALLLITFSTMQKILSALILTIFLFVAIVGVIRVSVHEEVSRVQSFGSNIPPTTYKNAGASTGVLVTTTSGTVLATSTSRQYAIIANHTGNPIFCNLDNGKPATTYSGVLIGTSTPYVISPELNNLYIGAINCITTQGTATTTIYAR